MARSAVQLYTLRNVEKSLPDLLARVHEAGFEGVEYANRIREADTGAVADALDETGLESVATHVGIDTLEDDLEGTIEFYRDLGCDRLVVPFLGASHFESEDAIEETADRLTGLADEVASAGATLGYHNHDHEFVDIGGRPAFERFAEASGESLGLELDMGWAAVGGSDPVSVLDRWSDRVELVHISDADENGSPAEVGEGVLDVSACAAAVREHGIEWAIYEHDEPTDPMASLDHGADVLKEF